MKAITCPVTSIKMLYFLQNTDFFFPKLSADYSHIEIFFLIFPRKEDLILTICMKFQILFSRKSKKNINLSSAELAQRVVKVKTNLISTNFLANSADANVMILFIFFFFFSEIGFDILCI